MNQAAILTFHDSVELFLHLSCDELKVPTKKGIQFADYWVTLKGKLPNGMSLGHEREMDRLNRLRVDLKHHYIPIAESEIVRARVNITNLFEEYTPIIFGVNFDKISMTDSVQHALAREYLNQATTFMEQGKFGDALFKLAVAFDMIIDDYEKRKESGFGKSVFHFGLPDIKLYSHHYNVDGDVIEFVKRAVEPMQGAMKIMSLGLDYRRYVKFRLLVPKFLKLYTKEGGPLYSLSERVQNRTEEHCQFCYDFIIDSAIRIQDFDFDIENL